MRRSKSRLTTHELPPHHDPSATWIRTPHFVVHGRHMERGTQLTIHGVTGRVEFLQHVVNDNGAEWLDCRALNGGPYRCFKPEQVKKVHYKKKVR